MTLLKLPLPLPPSLALSLLVLVLLAAANPATAMKQSWAFSTEDREQFLIERFGFGAGGRMDVHVRDVTSTLTTSGENVAAPVRAGLLFVHVRWWPNCFMLWCMWEEG